MIERIVRRLLEALGRVFRVPVTEKTQAAALQFVRFCLVGASNTAVYYVVNVLTLLLVERVSPALKYDYVIGNLTAFLVATYWSFYWNSRKVFHFSAKSRSQRLRALLRTYLCYAFTGILLNNALSTLWIGGLGISKYVAPLMNLVFTIPLNYLINKKWAFARPEE